MLTSTSPTTTAQHGYPHDDDRRVPNAGQRHGPTLVSGCISASPTLPKNSTKYCPTRRVPVRKFPPGHLKRKMLYHLLLCVDQTVLTSPSAIRSCHLKERSELAFSRWPRILMPHTLLHSRCALQPLALYCMLQIAEKGH
jgi:hypothetical protein